MHRGRRMQYNFHGEHDVPYRPTPVYPRGTFPQRTHQPFSHDSMLYNNVYRHPQSEWHMYSNTPYHQPVYTKSHAGYRPTGARVRVEPLVRANNPHGNLHYDRESMFGFHNLWTPGGGGSQFRQVRPENKFPQKPSGPIVDFPDHDSGVDHSSHQLDIEEVTRLREVPPSEDGLESVSTAMGSVNLSELELNAADYVPLETIRRVKEQAKQQAMRMRTRERQNSKFVEMSDTDAAAPRRNASAHYDRPRSQQRNTIPDGIVAGSHSNVSGRRMVSIPDPTHYATISDASEPENDDRPPSSQAPEPPERPPSFVGGPGPRYDRPPKRMKTVDSVSEPKIDMDPDTRAHRQLARFKRVICVFLLVVALLLLVVYGTFLLLFLLSEQDLFRTCRESVSCSNTVLIIAGSALAGCILLCLFSTCCCWFCFVCYTHTVNRRRAYPIHARHHFQHHHDQQEIL